MPDSGVWSRALEDLYAYAGCHPAEVRGVGWLAVRLLGDDSLKYGPSDQEEPVRLVPAPWRILVSESVDDADLTMGYARAIALWWLGRDAECAPDAGDVAALAAEIAVPFGDLSRTVDDCGDDVDDLADAFVVPVDVMRERLRLLHGTTRSGTYTRLVEAS